MKKLALFISIIGMILNQQAVKADEVTPYEVDASSVNSGSIDSSGEGNIQSDPEDNQQDNEVLSGEIENNSQEDTESNTASDPDNGQLYNLVQEFADSVGTYINFSYKMQIVNVAMLSIIAGSTIAFAIFNHFRD